MTNFKVNGLQINSMGKTAGVFWGKKNTHEKFQDDNVSNELFGRLNGNMNIIFENHRFKDRQVYK